MVGFDEHALNESSFRGWRRRGAVCRVCNSVLLGTTFTRWLPRGFWEADPCEKRSPGMGRSKFFSRNEAYSAFRINVSNLWRVLIQGSAELFCNSAAVTPKYR